MPERAFSHARAVPKTPACYGFSIITNVKDGREEGGPGVRQNSTRRAVADCRQPLFLDELAEPSGKGQSMLGK